MAKAYRYYIIAFILLLTGFFLLHNLLNDYNELEKQKIDRQLRRAHTDAMVRAKAGIEVYASLVSSLKSYTKNAKEFPTEIEFQKYLNDFLKEINFNDSIIVNYIDINHVFKYVITPKEIDPSNLRGTSVKNIRDHKRITELNELMVSNDIKLLTPINLREGWAGFPFNFSAKNSKGEILGYITPILNVKYLLDYFYENNNEDLYIHKFLINETVDLTREAYYNNSPIFNTTKDNQYYKNFDIHNNDFIYSSINLFGLKLKIGSAYKNKPLIHTRIFNMTYLWYSIISLLSFLALFQYFKNERLNKNLLNANNSITSKNKELELNLLKIKTLIKEIHHRIRNNMVFISGILSMQEREYQDENVIKALSDSRTRIESMSLVHEKLYNNESLIDIKLKEYLINLIDYVEGTIKHDSIKLTRGINIDEDLIFDPETTSYLGLIVNELLTNSFKHAFKSDRNNSIFINVEEKDKGYLLIYSDNGQNEFKKTHSNKRSLGLSLIQILTEQMRGTVTYPDSIEGNFYITFKAIKPI